MKSKKAMGQLGADLPEAESAPTIVGGQPPRRRFVRVGVPAGVERALFLAATDSAFREELLRDREAAVKRRGLELTPSEQAMLRLCPADQLESTIDSLDTSPTSLQRRGFMQAVAAGVAALAVGGCGDDDVKTDIPKSYPDAGVTTDIPQSYPDAGVTTDIPQAYPDAGVTTDIPQSYPDAGITTDIPLAPDAGGIQPDMPPSMKDGEPGDGQ
jgi:hypothetical protein